MTTPICQIAPICSKMLCKISLVNCERFDIGVVEMYVMNYYKSKYCYRCLGKDSTQDGWLSADILENLG